eukprot:TRINITY_DN217_c2_g1_i6.p1 TRINITY_DN217_c2_g1~~TRINITY_DN217_c2_g1_i6.p1  ORF type:complete len:1024 (-),score=379.64 TRINITY_DN217_c2_g1_i6:1692-4763(-)
MKKHGPGKRLAYLERVSMGSVFKEYSSVCGGAGDGESDFSGLENLRPPHVVSKYIPPPPSPPHSAVPKEVREGSSGTRLPHIKPSSTVPSTSSGATRQMANSKGTSSTSAGRSSGRGISRGRMETFTSSGRAQSVPRGPSKRETRKQRTRSNSFSMKDIPIDKRKRRKARSPKKDSSGGSMHLPLLPVPSPRVQWLQRKRRPVSSTAEEPGMDTEKSKQPDLDRPEEQHKGSANDEQKSRIQESGEQKPHILSEDKLTGGRPLMYTKRDMLKARLLLKQLAPETVLSPWPMEEELEKAAIKRREEDEKAEAERRRLEEEMEKEQERHRLEEEERLRREIEEREQAKRRAQEEEEARKRRAYEAMCDRMRRVVSKDTVEKSIERAVRNTVSWCSIVRMTVLEIVENAVYQSCCRKVASDVVTEACRKGKESVISVWLEEQNAIEMKVSEKMEEKEEHDILLPHDDSLGEGVVSVEAIDQSAATREQLDGISHNGGKDEGFIEELMKVGTMDDVEEDRVNDDVEVEGIHTLLAKNVHDHDHGHEDADDDGGYDYDDRGYDYDDEGYDYDDEGYDYDEDEQRGEGEGEPYDHGDENDDDDELDVDDVEKNLRRVDESDVEDAEMCQTQDEKSGVLESGERRAERTSSVDQGMLPAAVETKKRRPKRVPYKIRSPMARRRAQADVIRFELHKKKQERLRQAMKEAAKELKSEEQDSALPQSGRVYNLVIHNCNSLPAPSPEAPIGRKPRPLHPSHMLESMRAGSEEIEPRPPSRHREGKRFVRNVTIVDSSPRKGTYEFRESMGPPSFSMQGSPVATSSAHHTVAGSPSILTSSSSRSLRFDRPHTPMDGPIPTPTSIDIPNVPSFDDDDDDDVKDKNPGTDASDLGRWKKGEKEGDDKPAQECDSAMKLMTKGIPKMTVLLPACKRPPKCDVDVMPTPPADLLSGKYHQRKKDEAVEDLPFTLEDDALCEEAKKWKISRKGRGEPVSKFDGRCAPYYSTKEISFPESENLEMDLIKLRMMLRKSML